MVLIADGDSLVLKNDGLDVCKRPSVAVIRRGATSDGEKTTPNVVHLSADVPSRSRLTLELPVSKVGADFQYCSLGSGREGEACQCKNKASEEAHFVSAEVKNSDGPSSTTSDSLCAPLATARRTSVLGLAAAPAPAAPETEAPTPVAQETSSVAPVAAEGTSVAPAAAEGEVPVDMEPLKDSPPVPHAMSTVRPSHYVFSLLTMLTVTLLACNLYMIIRRCTREETVNKPSNAVLEVGSGTSPSTARTPGNNGIGPGGLSPRPELPAAHPSRDPETYAIGDETD